VRAIVFHPAGKHLLSASDDKTIRVWDLATGRCLKTVDAHGHFVTCMAWGRATMGGADSADKDKPGAAKDEPRRINVLATGSVDQTVKVSNDTEFSDSRSGHHEPNRNNLDQPTNPTDTNRHLTHGHRPHQQAHAV